MSLPLLTAKLSVVGKIMCFSSLSEVSTGPVALGKSLHVSNSFDAFCHMFYCHIYRFYIYLLDDKI